MKLIQRYIYLNDLISVRETPDINDEKTFKREVSPLFKIKDAYPKILLARTRHPETDYEGIRIIDIAEWLLQDND